MSIEPASPSELTALYEYLFGFAREMLAKRASFLPFGGQITTSQGPSMVAGLVEEHGDERGLYHFLLTSLQSGVEAGEVRAIALAADVDVPRKYQAVYPDAVRILLETPGYARFVYAPYRITKPALFERLLRRSNEITFAEPFSVEIPAEIFTSMSSSQS